MVQNVKKAIKMDQHSHHDTVRPFGVRDSEDEEDERAIRTSSSGHLIIALPRYFRASLTSSLVDDVFYLLQKCSARAAYAASEHAACAMLNTINHVMSRDYKNMLEGVLVSYNQRYQPTTSGVGIGHLPSENLASALLAGASSVSSSPLSSSPLTASSSSSASSVSASASPSASASSASLLSPLSSSTLSLSLPRRQKIADDVKLLLAINNLDVSTFNMQTLKSHLEKEFAEIGTESKAMVSHCLEELAETSKLMAKSARKGLLLLVNSITPRLRPLMDVFASANYELRESDYADAEFNDPFMQAFLEGVQNELLLLKPCLTDNNYGQLVSGLASFAAQRMEALVMKKTFTFWGGLQLDKDVRKLSSFFTTATSVSVRDKFARLVQMASCLQLDKVSEILDYWGENSGEVWRLYEHEVRKVLALRIDFSAREIQQLKL